MFEAGEPGKQKGCRGPHGARYDSRGLSQTEKGCCRCHSCSGFHESATCVDGAEDGERCCCPHFLPLNLLETLHALVSARCKMEKLWLESMEESGLILTKGSLR